MKTEVEFLEVLIGEIEADRSSVTILNRLENRISARLDALLNVDPPADDDDNRRTEGDDA